TISLTLKNATIPEVLEAARDVYGYEFVRTTYGFQVLPSRLEARVYQINYLNINRSGTSSTFVSSGTLQEGPSAANATDNADTGGTGSSRGRGQRTVVGTQISTEQPPTSFWTELQTALEAIVGNSQGRSVVVNPQSGVVVARAIPNELREVEAFLRATQLIAQRQVILEAKILEVQLSDRYQTGINWTAAFGDFTALQTGGGTTLNNQSGLSDIAGSKFPLEPGVTDFRGQIASAFGGVFGLAINANDFTAFIEFLETQGNVQVLSSPRISTMNNQKAVIKVGTDEFFVTDVSTTTVTGTATTSTPNIELTPFFSGIALDVTPQISQHSDVTLHIHPTVSQVVDQQKTITISN
ncbi:MAG: secretin N-terminal domain-containing protein, partial [Phycisphaerales bacterium]|nr:secretin N-terminal domain-containing protein [Phycisphaerales bacterium]